jgi:hypothetical protein
MAVQFWILECHDMSTEFEKYILLKYSTIYCITSLLSHHKPSNEHHVDH